MICFLNSRILGYEKFTIKSLSMRGGDEVGRGGLDLKSPNLSPPRPVVHD